MADTTFSAGTVITSEWLNVINDHVYNRHDEFNVLNYGAVADTGTDSTTAIQDAIDACEAAGGGTVYFPAGAYKVTATLVVSLPVTLRGANCRATILQVNHEAGPAVTFGDYFSGIIDMQVSGSEARLAAGNVADCGIKFYDTAGRNAFACFVRRCLITNHGGDAIFADNSEFIVVEDTRGLTCGRHGFYGDATVFDQPNGLLSFGASEIKNSMFAYCGGHGVCIGTVTPGFRVVLDNVDCFQCANDATKRNGLHVGWIEAQNVIVRSSAWDGRDDDDLTPNKAGIFIDGRNALVEACRFLNVINCAVELGENSSGSRVLDPHVVGEYQGLLDQAVTVHTSCAGVYVRTGFPANTTSPMSVGAGTRGNKSEWYDISPQGLRSSYSQVTIADDAIKVYTFSGVTYGVMVLSANSTASKPAIIGFRVGDASAYCVLLAGDATDIDVMTTDLTAGTSDGTDGKLNLSASTSANTLTIKNRQGSAANFMPTFLSLAGLTNGGELLLT